MDYDISFDNGATFETGQSLNVRNTSVHAGSQMIFKLNLDAGASSDIASSKDYAIMLFYE